MAVPPVHRSRHHKRRILNIINRIYRLESSFYRMLHALLGINHRLARNFVPTRSKIHCSRSYSNINFRTKVDLLRSRISLNVLGLQTWQRPHHTERETSIQQKHLYYMYDDLSVVRFCSLRARASINLRRLTSIFFKYYY